jgi:hypothetical protein
MSMSEPFMPQSENDEQAPAAAEPGPGAPGTPVEEEPDVLPGSEPADDELSLNEAALHDAGANGPASGDAAGESASNDTPASDSSFRTPTPGEKLTADELEDRI